MKNFTNILSKIISSPYTIIAIIALFVAVVLYKMFKRENFRATRLGRELVFFSMNGCGHCEDVKPVWDLLVSNYGNNDYIELKQVVAQERPELVKEYNVTGFPTILALKDGQINMKFEDERTYENLVKFMNHAMTD